MSEYELPYEINNSTVGNAKYIDGSKLNANFVKGKSEWESGTNTDFSISAGKVISLNTGMSSNNTIGTKSNTTVNANIANITTLNATDGTGLVPIGSVTMYAGIGSVPTGYLECDGSTVSRGVYPDLFSAISTRYGKGYDDGATFSLPDLRGEFVRGYDNGAGNDPDASSRTDSGGGATGDMVGTKQDYAVKDHFHKHHHKVTAAQQDLYLENHDTDTTKVGNYSSTGYDTSDDMDDSDSTEVGVNDSDGATITTTNSSTESRPKNIALMFIIRAL